MKNRCFISHEDATTEMASTTAKTITKANERITQYSTDLNLRRVHRNHILTTKRVYRELTAGGRRHTIYDKYEEKAISAND